MKNGQRYIIGFTLFLIFLGCQKDEHPLFFKGFEDGISLWWSHEVFGEGGRRLQFEFSGKEGYEHQYALHIDHFVNGNSIIIEINNFINKGDCQKFPRQLLCSASGRFSIPEFLLTNDYYDVILKTPFYEITSNLIIGDEKISLNIPDNPHFSSPVEEVYPIPKDILFGNVVYKGLEFEQIALDYVSDLASIGLEKTTIPNYPYRHLRVDENGEAINRHWQDENYKIGLLYKMNIDFIDVVGLSQRHYNKSGKKISISLYSWKGDQALFRKGEGVTIVYGD